MFAILRRLAKAESGVTAIEYGLIASLIAVAIVAVVGTVGADLNTLFMAISSGM